MTEKKKLIEVALPLEAINAACKADKDRKTGTIRNIHKWFAPMPVPALRALIFAALVDDPGDDTTRRELTDLIAQLVASVVDSPSDPVMSAARAWIARCVGGEAPVILDPFCGGGSTLVEAQRLGLASYGSDLNPIPVLISKALTEIPPIVRSHPPLHASSELLPAGDADIGGFKQDVLHYARVIYEAARSQLAELYPLGPTGDPAIAWFWARTVPSPDPRFQGAHTPLVGSWWLAKKSGEFGYIRPVVDRDRRTVHFEVATSGSPVQPSKGRCLFSDTPITFDYVRREGQLGRLGLTMMAMATHGAHRRRHYAPDAQHVQAAGSARPKHPPTVELPEEAIGFRVQGYGMKHWADLFTARQQVALETFAELVSQVPARVVEDGGDQGYARAVATVLGLCIGKLAQFSSTQCLWKIDSRNGSGKAESAKFGRNDVPMVADFVETNPFGRSVGDWMQIVQTSLRALDYVRPSGPPSTVVQADARVAGAELEGRAMVVTDPPYFATIGYANLSDYFYVWMRRALSAAYPELFGTMTAPKQDELIAEPARHAGSLADAKSYFIDGFTTTFESLKRKNRRDLPLIVIYALKEQQEQGEDGRMSGGWEAMLEAVLAAGLSITGTWPVHGTGSTRLRGLGANALATYVALVCRPRPANAQPATRRELLAALRQELGPAVAMLQQAAIAPVDLAQAVIGPGMAIFSRYSTVLDANGQGLHVGDALVIINQVLGEILEGQEADLDAATRWATAWYEQYAYADGSFGEADSLGRAKGIAVGSLVEAGIVQAKGSRVHLVERSDLSDRWDPALSGQSTVWETTQRVIQALATGGEEKASEIIRHSGSLGDAVRELAYRLYTICERRKWAKDALAYNGLVIAWPEIVRLASALPAAFTQQELL